MQNRLWDEGLDTFSLIFAIGGIVGWNGWFWMAITIIITLVSIDWFVVQFLVWSNFVLGKMRAWQWGDSASLAQASPSRLGESCRTSRLVWVALLAGRPWFDVERLSLAQARNSSPKRGREETWVLLSAISRPGEKYWCFEWLCLAQARDIRLSEVAMWNDMVKWFLV